MILDIAALDIGAAGAGLSGFEGACAIALCRAREAREAFEVGLREQTSVGRLSGLSAAFALEGDVESAADLLTQALDEAMRRKLPTRRRRVEGVRAAFLSHASDHPAVTDLRGTAADGVGRHWWRQPTTADYLANQLPDPVRSSATSYARPAGW